MHGFVFTHSGFILDTFGFRIVFGTRVRPVFAGYDLGPDSADFRFEGSAQSGAALRPVAQRETGSTQSSSTKTATDTAHITDMLCSSAGKEAQISQRRTARTSHSQIIFTIDRHATPSKGHG